MPGLADEPIPVERIVEVSSGRTISRAKLIEALRGCDFALLGELHDNPLHHRRRGELLAALGDVAVVAEHLPRGSAVHWGPALLSSLTNAGFDARAWRWPLHEPLFEALARLQTPLVGGNAPSALVRTVARDGEPALPSELRVVLAQAPIGGQARDALDRGLVDGHCGHLAGARMEGMRWAQRTRDASMWLALRDAAADAAPDRRPTVLLAGNGHVRTDFGVPQIAEAMHPSARLISVAFAEPGVDASGAPFDYVWITAPAVREDPCESLRRRPLTAAEGAGPVAAGDGAAAAAK